MVSSIAQERFLESPILSDLDSATRMAVLNVLNEDRREAGEQIIRQGETNEHIFVLIEGEVTIGRHYPEGGKELLAELKAPSIFGQTSFFQGTPSLIGVRAKTPVWLLTLDHPAHELLRRADPRAAEQLALATLRVLAEHFDLIDRRVSEFIRQHPEGEVRPTEWNRFRRLIFGESAKT